jgi:hypothetical protein
MIENLTTSAAITPTGMTYNTPTNTATFELARSLPNGNYQLVIPPTAVTDGVGHSLTAPTTLDFFILNGDANHDRTVDLTDFTILAANFNQAGRNFGQGNFDYDADGTVDLTDFTILAANFNKTLAASPANVQHLVAAPPPPAPAAQHALVSFLDLTPAGELIKPANLFE